MTTRIGTVNVEIGLPLESLLRLRDQRDTKELLRLMRRGDWRARALAVSALGRELAANPDRRMRASLRAAIVSRIRGLRGGDPPAALRGAFLRDSVANALVDRAWIVRASAALAIGETRLPGQAERIRPLLRDSHRPVRLAAAASLLAMKVAVDATETNLLESAVAAPARIGDTESSLEWLARLGAAHAGLLAALRPWGPGAPASDAGSAWAEYLAGDPRHEPVDSRQAEILRYAQEKETHYNFTKPFTRIDRAQNIRLLLAFLTVAENLRVPEDALVLDLGGGAGWVSELLAKFGYRPVTLDLSTSLIHIGRDRFRRENLPARFTAGDMTALPIRSASVDAVVVIDALHHVPRVSAVFEEAYRVLVPGGQFVLAEPGEGHAETDKSREEMSDYGVCEREIHLREAVAYGERAGFDRIQVIPHFVPSAAMSPADFAAAAQQPSERWQVRQNGQPIAFDELIVQSTLTHPIICFGKGERPLDSRQPRTLRASFDPRLVRDGATVRGTVRVTNTGDTLWLKGGGTAGRVRLGLQLLTPERQLVEMDFARAELPHDLAAGLTVDVPVEVTLPDAAASFVLKLDMVDEHICWFQDWGGEPVYVAID